MLLSLAPLAAIKPVALLLPAFPNRECAQGIGYSSQRITQTLTQHWTMSLMWPNLKATLCKCNFLSLVSFLLSLIKWATLLGVKTPINEGDTCCRPVVEL